MKCPHCGMETDTDELTNLTPEELIAHYYRARAAGSRKQLRQLAKESDIPYQTLRNRKVLYDRENGRIGYTRKRRKAIAP